MYQLRDTEIRDVIRILSRKTKNNPVLIGEPGVEAVRGHSPWLLMAGVSAGIV